MHSELEVFLHARAVGHLVETGADVWSFIYARAAIDQPQGGPVSLALPRDRESHHGDVVHAVFANLLPDGALRRRLAQSLGLSEGNDFGLLARLGGECAGALRLRVPGAQWRDAPLRRTLNDGELRNMVAVLPVHPLLAEADGLSKTLPGEFDKLPVRVIGQQVSVILGDELTTHIVKPAKPGLRESIMNEAYCMALASEYGLAVAPCEVLHGRVSVLAVTRLDRVDLESPRSLHMEDFCQALGHPPNRKYEREGGPRIADIAALLRHTSVQPALDLRALMRWAIFTFLIGFGAGHGKQLAMLHTPKGPRLAPFFGLWSTHVYSEMNFRMGFSIGHEDRPDWLTGQRWCDMATTLGVRPRYVLEELRAAATTLPRAAAELADRFQRRNGYADVIRSIRTVIEQRSRQVLVSLEAEPATAVLS
jgi:serine/threonine-protein kinase HipA